MKNAQIVKLLAELLSEDSDTTPVVPSGDVSPFWPLGANMLIRTVTHIQTGRIVAVGDKEIVLEDAAWIADTGRFADQLVACDFNEVEPFPDGTRVFVGRGAVIDAVQIDKLPRKQM